jgi:hypothetical protein
MFKLEIDTANDAFLEDSSEGVAEIIEDIAVGLRHGQTKGSVRDGNGNTVGNWELT